MLNNVFLFERYVKQSYIQSFETKIPKKKLRCKELLKERMKIYVLPTQIKIKRPISFYDAHFRSVKFKIKLKQKVPPACEYTQLLTQLYRTVVCVAFRLGWLYSHRHKWWNPDSNVM